MLPETRLVRDKIWPPDGVQPVTPPARVQLGDDPARLTATLTCADPGASIGYRTGQAGPWQVYVGPFAVAPGTTITVRTHRIGHRPATVEFGTGGGR